MQFQGAIIKEQGITFSIVIVKPYILESCHQYEETRNAFSHIFPGMPIILMAQDNRRRPIYQGRKDIVEFLSRVHISRIPWKRFNYN